MKECASLTEGLFGLQSLGTNTLYQKKMVASADLWLAEGSASVQPSMHPCSIKRCQFPLRISLRINHHGWRLPRCAPMPRQVRLRQAIAMRDGAVFPAVRASSKCCSPLLFYSQQSPFLVLNLSTEGERVRFRVFDASQSVVDLCIKNEH